MNGDTTLLTEEQLNQTIDAIDHIDPRDALILALKCLVHAGKYRSAMAPKLEEAVRAAKPFLEAMAAQLE